MKRSCFFLKSSFVIILLFGVLSSSNSQNNAYYNTNFLKILYKDSSYVNLKTKVTSEFAHAQPGRWGEFVKGVDEDFLTSKKYIAFTFDACGGPKRNGYDAELINFLQKENIPATLFITG